MNRVGLKAAELQKTEKETEREERTIEFNLPIDYIKSNATKFAKNKQVTLYYSSEYEKQVFI